MRTIFYLILPSLALLFMVTSCYYDNEVDLYPSNAVPCDTSNITYTNTIAPIMSANCNVCHNIGNPNGTPPVITSDYPGLKVVALNGKLANSVNWTNGQHKMPQSGSQLGPCDLAKINSWIKAGALDN